MSTEPGDRAVSPERDGSDKRDGRTWSSGSRPDQVIKVGNLKVDTGRLEADLGRGRVPLTRLEFLFLQELIRHRGQSVSRGQLLSSVWGYENDLGSNVVGVCVRRLRSKLGDQFIKTVRGEGYQLGAG
ncbi:MAG TPA: response regulator transcription factor [Trebonia sp.]